MIKKLNDHDLVATIRQKVRVEKRLTVEIISYLEEINQRRLYVQYKVDSLHKFCTRILKYSDAEAALRIKAMRVSAKAPQVKKKIETGEVSLNSLSVLYTFSKENPSQDVSENLELISGKSAREAVELLNTISDAPKVPSVKLKITGRVLTKLVNVQKAYENCSELELVEILLDEKLRALAAAKPKRFERGSKFQRYIPRSVQEEVPLTKCEGCGSRRNLQRDHIRPIAMGGKSVADNLRVLCFSCNQRAWIKNMEHSDALNGMGQFSYGRPNSNFNEAKKTTS